MHEAAFESQQHHQIGNPLLPCATLRCRFVLLRNRRLMLGLQKFRHDSDDVLRGVIDQWLHGPGALPFPIIASRKDRRRWETKKRSEWRSGRGSADFFEIFKDFHWGASGVPEATENVPKQPFLASFNTKNPVNRAPGQNSPRSLKFLFGPSAPQRGNTFQIKMPWHFPLLH